MPVHVIQPPALPYRDQPGRCAVCGTEVRPAPSDVFAVGQWSGYDPATGRRAGGTTFGVNCPECGVVLRCFGRGPWVEVDPASVIWHCDGGMELVGGHRWGGRPGAWSVDDPDRIADRLRVLLDRHGSPAMAALVLHLTTGLGAIPVAEAVERVMGLPTADARWLVVRALAPDRGG